MKVLSLFNGCSLALLSVQRAGFEVDVYAASEVDKFCNKIAMHRHPETVMLGDVSKVSVKDLGFVPDLVIGGSPCQGFSVAGELKAFEDPRSKLFWEFHRIVNEVKAINPDAFFFLENVMMRKQDRQVITDAMGVEPIYPDSSLVSCQRRPRAFWTNIAAKPLGIFGDMRPTIPNPEDRGIALADIRLAGVDPKYTVSAKEIKTAFKGSWRSKALINPDKTRVIAPRSCSGQLQVSNGTTLVYVDHKIDAIPKESPADTIRAHIDGTRVLRRLTPVEVCRCFNIPDWWFFDEDGHQLVSDTQIYKMCGSGWVVDLVAHILSFMPLKLKK